MENVDKIRLACHRVLGNPNLLPKDGKTFCNIGFYLIISELGHPILFRHKTTKEPLTANGMIDVLEQKFEKVSIEKCLNDLMRGYIFVAGAKGNPHGHIAIIYPTIYQYWSNSYNSFVPFVANIGKENAIMPLSFAFSRDNKPNIYFLGVPS